MTRKTLLILALALLPSAALAQPGPGPEGDPADDAAGEPADEPVDEPADDPADDPEADGGTTAGEAVARAAEDVPPEPAPAAAVEDKLPARPPAQTSTEFDRVLIQLNWGDDNLLLGSGETRENSPDPNFARCSRTQIDGIVRRDCAEGASRLGLYKQLEINETLRASGALVLGLGVVTDPESSKAGSVSLNDLGSYLKLEHVFGRDGEGRETVFFTELYPVDARPLVLGYHPDIQWGTKDEFPKNFRRGQAPGVKLGFSTPVFYAYAGAKSALIKSPLEVELENEGGNRILFATRTYYGVLGGFGVGSGEGFMFEVNGGFFHKGTLTKEGVIGKDLLSGGGSTRLTYQQGDDIGRRIDSKLYKRAALGAQIVEKTTPRKEETDWSVTGEFAGRVQNLSDFERPGSTANEFAWAGHLGFKLRQDKLRVHAEGRLRSLTYVTAEVPGFFPYTTIPSTAETAPEIQGLLAADYKLGDWILGLTGGVRVPSTYTGLPPSGGTTDPASAGVRTVVVSDADSGGWYILPAGDDALLVWWTQIGFKWQPAEEFAILGEVLYGRDPNRTQIERNDFGHAVRVYTEANVVAVNLMGQFLF